jgi:DNA-binding response OmpR family regulator
MANILIIESYPTLGSLYSEVCEEEGHYVFIAKSGEEAIDIAMREHIDLVIIDERLPDIRSEEVIKKIKELQPHMKGAVCARSEFTQDNYVALCEESFFKDSGISKVEGKVRKIISSKTAGQR